MKEKYVLLFIIIISVVAISVMFFHTQASNKVIQKYSVNSDDKNIMIDNNKIVYTLQVNGSIDDAQRELENKVSNLGLEGTRYNQAQIDMLTLLSSQKWTAFKEYMSVRGAQQGLSAGPEESAQVEALANSEQDLTNMDFETYYTQKYGGEPSPVITDDCGSCGTVYAGSCGDICITGNTSFSGGMTTSIMLTWWKPWDKPAGTQ